MSTKWPKPDKSLHVPIYGGMVYLFLDREKYNQATEFIGLESCPIDYDGIVYNYVNMGGGAVNLIGIFNDTNNVKVHECSHLAFNILGRAGVNAVNSEEAFAYLIGYLYDKLFSPPRQKKVKSGDNNE